MNHRLFYIMSGGIVSGSADYITQVYTKKDINYKQTLQMTLSGSIANGVFIPIWYKILQKKFGNKVFEKLIYDQFVYAPFSAIFWIGSGSIVNNESIYKNVKEKLLNIWFMDTLFWPFWNLIIFKYIKYPYQPYITTSGDFLWNMFLSIKTH